MKHVYVHVGTILRETQFYRKPTPIQLNCRLALWHFYTSIKANLQIRLYKSNVRMFIYIYKVLINILRKAQKNRSLQWQAKMWIKIMSDGRAFQIIGAGRDDDIPYVRI